MKRQGKAIPLRQAGDLTTDHDGTGLAPRLCPYCAAPAPVLLRQDFDTGGQPLLRSWRCRICARAWTWRASAPAKVCDVAPDALRLTARRTA